jgi:hypothetical protein
MIAKPRPAPLPDLPASVPGYRAVFVELETVQTRGLDGRHTGVNGHWVRRRWFGCRGRSSATQRPALGGGVHRAGVVFSTGEGKAVSDRSHANPSWLFGRRTPEKRSGDARRS